MNDRFDFIVLGSSCVDVVMSPMPLIEPIGAETLVRTDPFRLVTGGLVSNCGIALARLGAKVAAMSLVGSDEWADILRSHLARNDVDVANLAVLENESTAVTAVLVDEQQRHSFAHHGGACLRIDKRYVLDRLDVFRRSSAALIGYYSLLPELEDDLPELLPILQETGCKTAMDSAGGGGQLRPLDRMLPHLDVYFPSLAEASHQTGLSEPREIIEAFRGCGATGLLGVKLGKRGALISERPGEWLDVESVSPPGPIVDTVGAGDSFLSAFLLGLHRGLSTADAGRLGAVAGACCLTGHGASSGLRDWSTTARMAGL